MKPAAMFLILILSGALSAGDLEFRERDGGAASPVPSERPGKSDESKDVAFHLPFPPGTSYRVLFGPGGPPHHLSPRNRHAYDFDMPLGSEVSVSESGVVIHAESRFSGPTGRSQENNFVAIRHEGGLVSEYHHLMQDGVLVRVGERVGRGEVIGFSGESGKAEGPHLHFVVVRGKRSVPIPFHGKTEEGGAKGSVLLSKNVPPSREEEYRSLERGLDAARLLREEGYVASARFLLRELSSSPDLRGSPSARREEMALGAIRRRPEAELRAIERTTNPESHAERKEPSDDRAP